MNIKIGSKYKFNKTKWNNDHPNDIFEIDLFNEYTVKAVGVISESLFSGESIPEFPGQGIYFGNFYIDYFDLIE